MTAPAGETKITKTAPLRRRLPLAVIVFLAAFAIRYAATPLAVGDTGALVAGARAFGTCWSDGSLGWCPQASIFAPLQYLPTLTLINFHLNDPQVLQGLVMINLAAFVGTVALAWYLFADVSRSLASLAVVFVLSGPLLWYAGTSFAESLATFLMVALAVALVRRAHWAVILLLTFAACITKDVAAPFVVVLVVVGLLAGPGRPSLRDARGRMIAAAAGLAAGVGFVAASNLARWTTLTNQGYANPEYRVPGLGLRAELSVALWWSPAGGVVPFWPLAAVLVVVVALVAVVHLRTPGSMARAWPHLALVGSLIVLTVGLGGWYAPFGWIAWGPRLMLPVLTATLLLGISVCRDDIQRWFGRPRARRVVVAGIGAVVITCAVPHVAASLDSSAYLGSRDEPKNVCVDGQSIVTVDADSYFRCLEWVVWKSEPAGLHASSNLDYPPAIVGLFALFAFALWTLVAEIAMGSRVYREADSP